MEVLTSNNQERHEKIGWLIVFCKEKDYKFKEISSLLKKMVAQYLKTATWKKEIKENIDQQSEFQHIN